MTFATSRDSGVLKQRGFWLRCFLSGMIAIFLCAAGAIPLQAQLDLPAPERLAHVEGIVVNDSGHRVVDIEITLARDEQVVFRAQTDQSGEFRFDHVPSGSYLFRVKRSVNAPAERQIVVTDEV